jgi:protein-S-isoprenylcysteine O-methyltransferase Ste14
MLHILNNLSPDPAMRAIYGAWLLWWISWVIAAPFANRTTKRSPWMLVVVAAALGTAFLLPDHLVRPDLTSLWQMPETARWLLLAVAVAGFAFAWWARITLGRLWSGTITLKEGHHIVDTGPYALVRHPIYAGILLSAAATAAAQDSPTALAVAVVFVLVLTIKAWAEERFLARELGIEAYAAYRRRVPMLLPFLPKPD